MNTEIAVYSIRRYVRPQIQLFGLLKQRNLYSKEHFYMALETYREAKFLQTLQNFEFAPPENKARSNFARMTISLLPRQVCDQQKFKTSKQIPSDVTLV